MKIIHYVWGANTDEVLTDNLRKLGFDVLIFNRKCVNYTRDMEFAAELIMMINEQKVQAVISFDYFPIISMVCDVCKIAYHSIVYDSPHITLQAKCIDMLSNNIGVFDGQLVEQMKSRGIETVRHTLLPVDCDLFDNAIKKCERSFSNDISFVGSLYTDNYNYYDQFKNSDAIWKEIDELVTRQCFDYSHDYIRKAVWESKDNGAGIYKYLNEKMQDEGLVLDEDYYDIPEDIICDEVLNKKVTVEERRKLLCAIGCKYKNRMSIYTGSDLSAYSEIKDLKKGYVDYLSEMPKVFNDSKINLNITLRSIQSGIPLRALDVMACGGFLLTNPQSELFDYFEEGKDFVAFYSVEDCLNKIDYYLENEEERANIARSGLNKVKEICSYERILSSLMNY